MRFQLYCTLCDPEGACLDTSFGAGDSLSTTIWPHCKWVHGWPDSRIAELNYFGGGKPYRYDFYTDDGQMVGYGRLLANGAQSEEDL